MVKKTIEELSKEYDFLVADTSVLVHAFSENTFWQDKPLTSRIDNLQYQCSCCDFWKTFLEGGGNLYTTLSVLEECVPRFRSRSKKGIKSMAKVRSYLEKKGLDRERRRSDIFMRERSRENLYDSTHNLSRSARALSNSFVVNGRVIIFREEEKTSFEDLSSQYYSLKLTYKIGDVDFELLMSAGIFALNKGRTCLITNDYGILTSGQRFNFLNGSRKARINLYSREDINSFRER